MSPFRLRGAFCWFGATLLALAGLLLVLDAISVSAPAGWSAAGYMRLVLAGCALVGVGALMSMGFRSDRRGDGS